MEISGDEAWKLITIQSVSMILAEVNTSRGALLSMAKKDRRTRIPEQDTIDIILKRISGKTLEEVAQEYGVSKQVIQYHEKKS